MGSLQSADDLKRAAVFWKNLHDLAVHACLSNGDEVFDRYMKDMEGRYSVSEVQVLVLKGHMDILIDEKGCIREEKFDDWTVVLGYNPHTRAVDVLYESYEDRHETEVGYAKHGSDARYDPGLLMNPRDLGGCIDFDRYSRIDNDIIYGIVQDRLESKRLKMGIVLSLNIHNDCGIAWRDMMVDSLEFAKRMYYAWTSIAFGEGAYMKNEPAPKKLRVE